MQEWKASEKEAQKMTRDGAISVNLVTGEATHISDRPPEQDYSSADETAGALNRAADEVVGHRERRQAKKARRKRRDTFREGEAARDRPSSRLQFSETDQAAPELKKAIQVGQGGGSAGRGESCCPRKASRQGTWQPIVPAGAGNTVHPPRRSEQGGGR